MTLRNQALVTVGILAVFDTVIPIPFTALFVIYCVLQRPPWVIDLVRDVYGADALNAEDAGIEEDR